MSKVFNWECEKCGKKLKIEEPVKDHYQGKDNCLECRGLRFYGDIDKTALGKTKIAGRGTKKNISNISNEIESFTCYDCKDEIIVEGSMFEALYDSYKSRCLNCRGIK